jgi:hypothetical protein
MSTAFSDACIHCFPHVWCNSVTSFFSHGNGSTDDIFSICFAQENREIYPWTLSGMSDRNTVPGSVRQWTVLELVQKTSLHLDCWKTTDGLARAAYNMTWLAWIFVYLRYCMFINTATLYSIVTVNRCFNMDCAIFKLFCSCRVLNGFYCSGICKSGIWGCFSRGVKVTTILFYSSTFLVVHVNIFLLAAIP